MTGFLWRFGFSVCFFCNYYVWFMTPEIRFGCFFSEEIKKERGIIMNSKTKKITIIAMLCAISYVVMMVGRFPVVLFLKYDPKDVIIALGGLIYGPMSAMIISVIVSFVEMFTASDTGFIGLVMNILSTCAFCCTAAFIYKKKHTIHGAVAGLAAGTVAMVIAMILWNYLVTPIYMGAPREQIAAMLVPVFLPFNLMKGGLNAAVTFLLYKPIVTGLRKAGMIETAEQNTVSSKAKAGVVIGYMLLAVVIIITCILFILTKQGII